MPQQPNPRPVSGRAAGNPSAVTADAGTGDIIQPTPATRSEDLGDLIADAISDGDLQAALSYYEPAAILAVGGAAPAVGLDAIRRILTRAVEAKTAYEVHPQRSLIIGEIALLAGRWSRYGARPDGTPTAEAGSVSCIARRGPDRAWRVAAQNLTPDAYDVSPRTPRDAHSTPAQRLGTQPP
ncbi:YybH family protein [Leekyejoonella antrihumi]|uniref:Uncharacterized protein n=1 Tax=Leekyejoonella antrihumi TaxID=1660198 RepID=A0A563DSI2_9MICO|nr:DUF4440 domain-containing protein [Leekyejoonella antrihumi]TWP33207.1 hypothetical protein FGL98_22010 [Leekyejoonella antrihumi]